MAKPKRLSKKFLQEDREAYAALQAIEGYDPSNKDFTLAKITESFTGMNTDQTSEVQKHAAADASSDKAAESEHKFTIVFKARKLSSKRNMVKIRTNTLRWE